jgi:crossover junction endodeoxyribonuclease RuvC
MAEGEQVAALRELFDYPFKRKSAMRFIGIDIGVSGALAMICYDGSGWQVDVRDMPVLWIKVSGKNRRVLDERELWELLKVWRAYLPEMAIMEAVHPVPKQGGVSNFGFGRQYGMIEMALVGNGYEYDTIPPQRWKKEFGLIGKGKGNSRQLAARLFPGADLGERGDEGRAEALLLALYGARIHPLVKGFFTKGVQDEL